MTIQQTTGATEIPLHVHFGCDEVAVTLAFDVLRRPFKLLVVQLRRKTAEELDWKEIGARSWLKLRKRYSAPIDGADFTYEEVKTLRIMANPAEAHAEWAQFDESDGRFTVVDHWDDVCDAIVAARSLSCTVPNSTSSSSVAAASAGEFSYLLDAINRSLERGGGPLGNTGTPKTKEFIVFGDRLPPGDSKRVKAMLVFPDILTVNLKFYPTESTIVSECESRAEIHYADPGLNALLNTRECAETSKILEGLNWEPKVDNPPTPNRFEVKAWYWPVLKWDEFLRERRQRLLDELQLLLAFVGIATCARRNLPIENYPISLVQAMLGQMSPDLFRCKNIYIEAQVCDLLETFGPVIASLLPSMSARQKHSSLLKYARLSQARVLDVDHDIKTLAQNAVCGSRYSATWLRDFDRITDTPHKQVNSASPFPIPSELKIANRKLRDAESQALRYMLTLARRDSGRMKP